MSNKFDANSIAFTSKIIRIGHNRRVKKYFKDVTSDTASGTGRQAIKTALLIRKNDSLIEINNKLLYFSNYLAKDNVVSSPDGWQIKKGQNIPQLSIIYRAISKNNKSGNYTLNIPHYNGQKNIKPPQYTKGKHWVRWVLKDNSHLIIHANSEAEAFRVIRKLEKYVNSKYRTKETDWTTKGIINSSRFKTVKVAPVYADYYAHGKENNHRDWRVFL